jgi:L-ascorbate metabolism protein UlaG (beta-lactamase superfamily)
LTSIETPTGTGRRRALLAAAAAAGGALAAAALPSYAGPLPARRPAGSSGTTLRWLGNNAWEITTKSTTILVDPWVTRFPTGTYTPAGIRADTPLVVDRAAVDRYLPRADLILVCHGHFDHLTDVPYVAERTGATVLGTESHHNMLRALGAPAGQLTTMVGGERLLFGDVTVEVFESLHSMTGPRRQVPFPGTRPGAGPLPRPATVADLVEGGTLAYQITVERYGILVLSTANFIERALAGARPDLAIVAAGGATVPDYAGRLLRALHHPAWVLPTHWDDFDLPLDRPARDWGGLDPLRAAVAAASPRARFRVLDHLETFTP